MPAPTDAAFDALLPPAVRAHAAQHFTPAADAIVVGAWLDELGVPSLCDLGAGVGKLCVIAATAAPRCRFVGVEHRASLVAIGRALSAAYGVADRVTLVEGAIGAAPPPAAAAYYLYNPFGEHLLPPEERIDDRVALSDEGFERDVAAAEALLAAAPAGTWLVTHDGFGGVVPAGFREVRRARRARGEIVLRRRA